MLTNKYIFHDLILVNHLESFLFLIIALFTDKNRVQLCLQTVLNYPVISLICAHAFEKVLSFKQEGHYCPRLLT